MIPFNYLFADFALYVPIFAIFAVLFTLYLHRKHFNVWTSQGIRGPKPWPLIGNVLDMYNYTFADLFTIRAKQYGRLYGTFESSTPKLVVADANLVKQICVKDFHLFVNRRKVDNLDEVFANMLTISRDEHWKRLRKIMSPTFSTGKIKRMKPLIEQCVRNAVEHLDTAAANGEELNLKQFWSRFTLEVIARCGFATEVNSHKDPDNPFFKHVTSFSNEPSLKGQLTLILFFVLPSWIFKLLRLNIFENESTDYLKNVVIHLLKQRRLERSKYNDFLHLLVEAENENDHSERPLTENEIVANCLLFFLAGHETTATLLQYVCFALAMNPAAQEKLYEEINEHVNLEEDVDYDYDLVNKLAYFDAIISETLRMFPPAVMTERTASVDVEYVESNVKIPANSLITFPVYAIHHDAEYYPEPELFKPERFLAENRDNINPYAYMPFGVGPRNCIAMRFALLETKLALFRTVANFKIVKCGKTAEPKFIKFSELLTCNDLFVKFVKR